MTDKPSPIATVTEYKRSLRGPALNGSVHLILLLQYALQISGIYLSILWGDANYHDWNVISKISLVERYMHSTSHNDTKPWWCHRMETSSALMALCEGNLPVPVDSPRKGQWRRALMFSLICKLTNGWTNNRDTGDLRHHYSHYDVTVIQ